MDQNIEANAIVLEGPEVNEIYATPRVIEVFEIEDRNPAPSRSKCVFILIAWLLIFLSLIILKTLF